MRSGSALFLSPHEAVSGLPAATSEDLVMEGAGLQAGYRIAPACVITTVTETVAHTGIALEQADSEVARLEAAAASVLAKLEKMVSAQSNTANAKSGLSESLAYLRSTHQVMEEVVQHIRNDCWAAEYAVQEAFDRHARSIDDPLTRDRAYEARDIKQQLILALNPRGCDTVEQMRRQLAAMPGPKIVVVENLSPAEALQLLNQQVEGVVIYNAGHFGHQQIILREIHCPVVGNIDLVSAGLVRQGEEIVVDGDKGFVTLRPSSAVRERAKSLMTILEDEHSGRVTFSPDGVRTACGAQVRLCGDLTNIQKASDLARQVGEIGLVRTEFLFLQANQWPAEDQQLEIFRGILQGAAPHGVTLRTFDFGYDKTSVGLECYDAVDSGLRGIRYALAIRPDELHTQLRAMIRAAAEVGNEVRIIFPMVLDAGDMRKAKGCFSKAVTELVNEGSISGRPANIKLGPMIETSSAVELINPILSESDIISIGTNDLLKSTLDGDLNKATGAHYHPANLSCIRRTIAAADKAGKVVYVCGDMPCHTKNIPLLIGVGARFFCVSSQELGAVSAKIGRCNVESCVDLAQNIIDCGDGDQAYSIHVDYLAALGQA